MRDTFRNTTRAIALITIVGLASAAADAAPVTYTNEANFLAAAGGTTLESFEGLAIMESGLLGLGAARPDPETIDTIFRAAHSIKGGSGTFGAALAAAFIAWTDLL